MEDTTFLVKPIIILMLLISLKGHIRPWLCFRTMYLGTRMNMNIVVLQFFQNSQNIKHTQKNAGSSQLDRFVMAHNILKKNPKKII